MYPRLGSTDSGKIIKLIGDNFSNVTMADMAKCKFTLIGNVNSEKVSQIIEQTTPAIYNSKQVMHCWSPGVFRGGDRASVQITFNGMDYSDYSDDLVF